MAFSGKYQLEKEENGDIFYKTLGKARLTQNWTEIVQSGDDFTWTTCRNNAPLTNTFTLNKECELTGPAGQKIKTTVVMLGGKIILHYLNVLYNAEVIGDKLIENLTSSGEEGANMKRVSKRL